MVIITYRTAAVCRMVSWQNHGIIVTTPCPCQLYFLFVIIFINATFRFYLNAFASVHVMEVTTHRECRKRWSREDLGIARLACCHSSRTASCHSPLIALGKKA
jgi:hypothetical protein